VPNVGASLESREVRRASGSSKSTLVTATAALFPARALRRLPPPAYSPQE
jgi:hypothetical protein